MVLAPEHPLVRQIATAECRHDVEAYVRQMASRDLVARKVGDREKSGVFTGAYARNPATGQAIPVWIADYVLMEYGTGAIMAVPGHDERDFAFAKKFGLDIVRVIAGQGQDASTPLAEAWTDNAGGRLVNSGSFNGRPAEAAKGEIIRWLESQGSGKGVVQYRLHDWCISRQRYWGPPIPVIYCDACGAVPVPEKDLPVLLPAIEDFRPDDSGVSPLARHKEWYFVPCPSCGKRARRETDVSDTFLDSAWYYLRYTSTEFADRPFDSARTRKWCPVATYIGGNEHAVLHLLYSRFIAMVLHDLGHLEFEEPFARFRAHGLIVKDGSKMSKSRGNVVIPDDYIAQWGADTFRMYLMFLGPFQEGGDFRDAGISGPRRFLDKVWDLVGHCERATLTGQELHQSVLVKRHQTVKRVTEGMDQLSYNTAIAALMELLNVLRDTNCTERHVVKDLLVMLAPFAPHFAEECWERLGSRTSIFDASWPSWDERLTVEDTMEIPVQVNGKTRSKVRVPRAADEAAVVKAALGDATVARLTDGKEVRKRIYVPGRLLNIVVG
jgi:leucyl-tRNA synthetase